MQLKAMANKALQPLIETALPTPASKTICATGRILAAAEQLFSELGYDAVSTSVIAERAGVSKANIYHHFASKHALYIAVLSNGCKASASKALGEIEQNGSHVSECIRHFSDTHTNNLHDRERVSRLILREVIENQPGRGQELAEQVFGGNFCRLVEVLRDSQRRGELREGVDPAMLATLLIGANVFFFQSKDVLRHFPDVHFADDRNTYSRMLTDILLHGVLTNPKECDDQP